MFLNKSLKKNRPSHDRAGKAKKVKMDTSTSYSQQSFIDYDMEDGSMPSPLPSPAIHESTSFHGIGRFLLQSPMFTPNSGMHDLQKTDVNQILDYSMEEEQMSSKLDWDDDTTITPVSNNDSFQSLQIANEIKFHTGMEKETTKIPQKSTGSGHKFYKRSVSDVTNEATNLEMALHKAAEKIDNLCNDQGETLSLPIIKGQKADCNSISCQTMRDLLDGKYHEVVPRFHVIDCRYPYEFEGGHIKGAVNIHNKDDIITSYINKPQTDKVVLIFHCEFSSKRGPSMYKHLRNSDRNLHFEDYPALHYPEIYLLDGGYKAFWNHSPDWCDPRNYKTMDDINHQTDLRYFKSKSKTWTLGEGKLSKNGKQFKQPLKLFDKENKGPSKKFSKLKSTNFPILQETSPCNSSTPFVLSSSPSIDNPDDVNCIFNLDGSAQKLPLKPKNTSSPMRFRRKLII